MDDIIFVYRHTLSKWLIGPRSNQLHKLNFCSQPHNQDAAGRLWCLCKQLKLNFHCPIQTLSPTGHTSFMIHHLLRERTLHSLVLVVWHSGSVVRFMNKVMLHWTQLVLKSTYHNGSTIRRPGWKTQPLFFGRPYYRSSLWYSMSSVVRRLWRFVLWQNGTS